MISAEMAHLQRMAPVKPPPTFPTYSAAVVALVLVAIHEVGRITTFDFLRDSSNSMPILEQKFKLSNLNWVRKGSGKGVN